jgi:hypothetical protein
MQVVPDLFSRRDGMMRPPSALIVRRVMQAG